MAQSDCACTGGVPPRHKSAWKAVLMRVIPLFPAHQVHIAATFAAGRKHRLVLLHGEGGGVACSMFCLRSAGCEHCTRILARLDHVSLGTVQQRQGLSDIVSMSELESELEVNEIPGDRGVPPEVGPQ